MGEVKKPDEERESEEQDNLYSDIFGDEESEEEPDKGNLTEDEEESEEEESGEKEEEEEEGEEGEFYSDEELKALAESGVDIDTSKIPKKYQAIYKSFQAGYTRKTQALAEERRQVEQYNMQQMAQLPVETLMTVNPIMAIQKLDKEITELQVKRNEQMAQGNLLETLKINTKIEEFQGMRNRAVYTHQNAQALQDNLMSRIPNYRDKLPRLTEFAKSLLPDDPLTIEELNYLTNPLVNGTLAIKMARVLDKLYEGSVAAKKRAFEKLKKRTPSQSLGGGDEEVGPSSSKKPNSQKVKELRKKVRAGDESAAVDYLNTILPERKE